ncbi:MAG: DNA-binding protein [Nanoarchaeota archaeon]
MDNELEELKKRRLDQLRQTYSEQLQRQMLEQQQGEADAAKQLEAVEEVVKAHLTKEALQRYGTLKLAHPETATRLLIAIAQALETGKLRGMLSDGQLISALQQLSRLSQKGKSEIRIIRK